MATYCCTIDVVTRKLPTQVTKFPVERERLLRLMEEDQQDRASNDFLSASPEVMAKIAKQEIKRTEQALAILERIKTPSARNIGLDGSRAIWLIALHNPHYKDAGRRVLKKMRNLYYKDKTQVFYPGIPYLADRIMIASSDPIDLDVLPCQLYGTQGIMVKLPDGSIRSELFPIKNRAKLQERRRKFGLEPKSSCQHQQ